MKKYCMLLLLFCLPVSGMAIELVDESADLSENSLFSELSSSLTTSPETGALEEETGAFPSGKFLVSPDSAEFNTAKRVQDTPDFEKVRSLDHNEADYTLAKGVGALVLADGSGRQPFCSGFLVGENLFMTNHHCVYNDLQNRMRPIERMEVHMDYLSDGKLGALYSRVEGVLIKNSELDFALLALEKPLGRHCGWLPLNFAINDEQREIAVKIIQHPAGRSKEIVRNNSNLVGLHKNVVHYIADTEGGSSGSPVFDLHGGTVIALHHVGTSRYNEGVRMTKIFPYIARYLPQSATPSGQAAGADRQPRRSNSEDDAIRMIEDIFK